MNSTIRTLALLLTIGTPSIYSQEEESESTYSNFLAGIRIYEDGTIERTELGIETNGFCRKPLKEKREIYVEDFNDTEFKKLASVVAFHITVLDTWNSPYGSISSLAPLQPFSSITSLDLSNNELTTIEELPLIETVRKLSLSNNMLMDITALSKCTSLQEVYLDGNYIRNVSPLKKSIKNIQKLKIDRNALKATSVKKLIRKREKKETESDIREHGASEVFLHLYEVYSRTLEIENNKLKNTVGEQKYKITILEEDISRKRPHNDDGLQKGEPLEKNKEIRKRFAEIIHLIVEN